MSTLLALGVSSAAGWSLALHLATDDDHSGGRSSHRGALGLAIALHGHAHTEGTPPHDHHVVTSIAAPAPGRLLLQIGASIGDVPDVAIDGTSASWLSCSTGSTHDPPIRPEVVSVLRI